MKMSIFSQCQKPTEMKLVTLASRITPRELFVEFLSEKPFTHSGKSFKNLSVAQMGDDGQSDISVTDFSPKPPKVYQTLEESDVSQILASDLSIERKWTFKQ